MDRVRTMLYVYSAIADVQSRKQRKGKTSVTEYCEKELKNFSKIFSYFYTGERFLFIFFGTKKKKLLSFIHGQRVKVSFSFARNCNGSIVVEHTDRISWI